MEYLADCLNLPDIARRFAQEAETLKNNIREHCWDRRDGFYYSVDLNLLPVEKPDIESLQPGALYLHVGQPRTYDCLIQRLSVWSGFMAMWAGIATPRTGRGDGTAPLSRHVVVQCTGRYPHPLTARKDVRYPRQR